MKKRFTDAEKWRDPWFRELAMETKLAWLYLCDTCDAAGVWVIDMKGFYFETGINEIVDLDAIVEELGDRVRLLPNGRLQLVKFIDFQYPRGLAPTSAAQLQVLRLMQKHGISIPQISGTPSPTPVGRQSLQDKDKEKDREKDKDKDKETERPDPTDLFSPPTFHVDPKSESLSGDQAPVPVKVVRDAPRPPVSDIDQLVHAGATVGREEGGRWQLLVDTFGLDRVVSHVRKVAASGERAFRSTVAASLGHAPTTPTEEYKIIDGQRVRVIR